MAPVAEAGHGVDTYTGHEKPGPVIDWANKHSMSLLPNTQKSTAQKRLRCTGTAREQVHLDYTKDPPLVAEYTVATQIGTV